MSDFESGRLYHCPQCGRPVRLYGHNQVTAWTCEPCRTGSTLTLLEDGEERVETAERYDPELAAWPEGY